MPTARHGVRTSVVNGKIYAIGGNRDLQLSTVEEYDPATDTWIKKTDMPTARGSLSTSVVNGKIYAIGGGSTSVSVTKVEEYDPTTDTWTQKANMPEGRDLHSTSVVNGKIYAFGGQIAGVWNAFGSLEMYDPETDTWTKKAYMPALRTASPTSVVDGKILVFGGTANVGGAPLSTLFQYDPATDTWTEQEDMPVRMLGMCTSAVGRRIYVIGGTSASYPYSSLLSTVWEFIPSPTFDFNKDGIVDAQDVVMMVAHWHTDSELYDIAPLSFGDGFVDVQDLILLSEHLFEDYRTVAHWTLDETDGLTAHDSLGVNDGFVIGNPVWLPDGGQVGGAIQLDGVDDYVGTPFVWNPGEGLFSVFAWIQGGAPGQVIVSQQGGVDWLATDALAGALSTGLRSGSRTSGPLVSEATITDGHWHHIGFTWDGSIRRLYVDDTLVAEDPESGLIPCDGGLNIGCSALFGPGSFFAGRIDNVIVYNRAVKP